LIEKWEKIIGVKTNDFGVKNMRTRWGTCNVKDKRIWINLQLAKKPVACLEYIVVHELVHLLEKNHTPVFIEYMDKFLPGWRVTKDELNGFIMDKYFEE
jgi:predicted metal-dependent hydrolase